MKNRLEESLALFRMVVDNHLFTNSSPILFLNNTDLFAEQILRSPLADHFPDYDGFLF
jgi:guanine nucleotide-binding protein subunit alpha